MARSFGSSIETATKWTFLPANSSFSFESRGNSSRQGTPIAASAALPGDLVVMDGGGHIGIYLGGNMMIDAPRAGETVQVRAIYTSNHWFVRYGI